MEQLNLLLTGIIALFIGATLGYYARQSLVKKRKGTIEAKLEKRAFQVKKECEEMTARAKERSLKIVSDSQIESDSRRKELLKTEEILLKREHILEKKISNSEIKEKEFEEKIKKLKEIKENLLKEKENVEKTLESISGFSKEEAKERLLESIETSCQKEFIERMKKLREEGEEKFKSEAKEILTLAIQKYALSQAQEITTTTVPLPSEEIKGRVIGKEGRNIRTFEKLTGVELIIDEIPEAVIVSGFNPLRRQIAKSALEKLIKDGRIQPAKIEEQVKKAKEEIDAQTEEFGKNAVYEAEIIDLPSKLVKLLGRLHFRTSYGQNMLLHSLEVSFLSTIIAEEVGANTKIARKAGLLHDIGKAIDQEIEGSHVKIGIKILEKFNIEKEVIDAMKAHHEEYEANSIEAIIVKTADQISGARPGARKDTVENYIKRLEELEGIANSFNGVEKSYAIQAGRELRVFVKPESVGDLEAFKLAKDIAERIQQETNYPGEIKVCVIRETRVIEYAR